MIKIQYLEPFNSYRVHPPIIAPENKDKRKKGHAYIIIAPSIKDELNYMEQQGNLTFRHLYKYFIDKKVDITLYGSGRKVIKMNEDGDITALLENHKRGNLSNIDGVTSYLSTAKTRPLKNLNVLVEVNHITDLILNNQSDHRLVSFKAQQCLKEYQQIFKGISEYMGDYEPSIFIPMNLWFTKSDYGNPSLLLKANSKNFMGHFLYQLAKPENLKKFKTVYLLHDNYVLPLNHDKLPKNETEDYVMDSIRRFMLKVRSGKSIEDTKDTEEIKIVQDAETKTKKEIAVDEILTKSKTNPDLVSPSKKEELEKTLEDSNTEESGPVEQITTVSSDAADALLTAKLSGQSIQSQKRNELLKTKYKDLNIGDTPLTAIIEDEKQYEIPELKPKANTVNDDMKSIKSSNFERSYNEKLAMKDLVNILLHFQHVDPPMYLNKDIQVMDVSDNQNRVIKYTVEYEDTDRKRHRFSFLLPKPYKDRYFFLNGAQLDLSHQKVPFPVTKIAPDKCQAVGNYKKLFMERYGDRVSPSIQQIKKLFFGPNCPKFASIQAGDATKLNQHYLTTIEYADLASAITRLTMGSLNNNLRVFFIVDDAKAVVDMTPVDDKFLSKTQEELDHMLPLAVKKINKKNSYYYVSGTTNIVYNQDGEIEGELSEFIIKQASEYDSKITEKFDKVPIGSRFMYTRCRVMEEYIPTIVFLGAVDPNGLIGVLEKAKLNYSFTTSRPKEDRYKTGIIQFADGYLSYDRYPYENSLLLNGLSIIPTKEFNFYDMGTRDTYVDIFDLLYNKRHLIDGLETFYYMFIDPITMDVLIRLNMPTDFTRLMLYCNGILVDNTFQIDSDYHNSRIRSNEIVYAYLYEELAMAWGKFRSQRAEKFSIPEDAIIKTLITSNIADPHTQLNLSLELENSKLVKLKGPSGMNEDRSFTLEKRAFHPSMKGIVGINSTPSGEVGIGRHLTTSANIIDTRGFVEIDKDEYSATELITPGELLQAFGIESSDMERVAMALSQSKHVIPVEEAVSSPVSYDMERIAPYLSTDYAFSAKKDGKVLSIENDVMIIQYNDGTYDDIDLAEHPAKNTDGGFFVMNQLKTKLKPGQAVKEGQLVATDHKYINEYDMFNDPLASAGVMARVSLETNGGVYEDACYITDDLAHRMKTRLTKQKRVILSRHANVKKIATIGDSINVNDIILSFDDTEDEFSSKILSTLAKEADDEDEIIATSAPIFSKVAGVIKDIQITYVTPIEDLTPSLQKIIKSYIADATKREKVISKYMNLYDANTIAKTSSQQIPDASGRVGGVKITDGVVIDFYIETEDIMAPGDKLAFFAPLKGIVSDVIPTEYAAYSLNNPDRKIDACLSCIGMYRRMCLDIIKVGGLNKVLIERKRQMAEKYQDRIKKELKK